MVLLKRAINRLGRPLGINPFPRSFENPLYFKNHSPKRIFDEIHRYNFWGSNESLSGVGSERGFAKVIARVLLKP